MKIEEDIFMEFINGVNYVSDVIAFPAIVAWIFIAIIIILFGALFGSVILIEYEYKAAKTLFCVSVSMLGICWIVFAIIALFDPFNLQEPTGEYEVSISSEVNMDEFLNTYEIVEYDDDDRTFTIKVREQ